MKSRKIVLIGAGSASFTVGLVADILAAPLNVAWTISLVDISEEALAVAKGLVEKMVQKKGIAVKVEATTNRCEVLPGADVVVCTIAVGGRKGWENDVLIPQKYGIYQPVGDTVMAGGISRALRQIPAMLDIARDVHKLCPQAYFFNYSNPMAAICRAITKATPARVVGLCHGVQGTVRYLCEIAQVPYDEVEALYVGMNHLTWITHLYRDGESLWPVIDAKLSSLSPDDTPFSWELYKANGAFPAVLDRHVTEFFPERFPGGAYYGKQLGVDVWDILDVIHGGEEHFQHMARLARGEEELDPALFERNLGEHEALVPIVVSLFGGKEQVFPMNVPNTTVKGIPEGFVLEIPVVASTEGCLPMGLPPAPVSVLAWTTEALYGVELTVNAAISGCRKALVQALLYDRSVQELSIAEKLADDLLAAHKAHLPQFE